MKTILSLIVCLCSMSAMAQSEIKYSPQYLACLEKSNDYGDPMIIIFCINTELKKQDTLLNKHYNELKNSLTLARQRELTTLQRLWLKYRDAQCKFYKAPDGGALHRMLANQCILDMTAIRTTELIEFKLLFSVYTN